MMNSALAPALIAKWQSVSEAVGDGPRRPKRDPIGMNLFPQMFPHILAHTSANSDVINAVTFHFSLERRRPAS